MSATPPRLRLSLHNEPLPMAQPFRISGYVFEAMPATVVRLFNQAIEDGRLATAGDMLGNLGDLSPGDPAQGQLRDRLAGAWLDRAEQQLDSGDRPGAAQSLDRVRKLAPQHPRLAELSARLNAEP